MSAKITRLRIAGFKSFADPATIDILPGLTGIVGPNGCGKSNVVEALRWAMGESSARALRGGELDDLIFAGTSARSARSLAEVTLWLEEATGLAPHPFGEADGLEICRRAERGSGSDFRLNGRALRARDITTMFADLSSGARSSSIVSQNRVSALISAKPEERRSLLEEAAGISGLHARRHDAELKLRQAEGNMERSEDLRQQLNARLEQLEAQSTQARAYRGLSEAIREDESALSWLAHKRAALLVERTTGLVNEAEKQRDEAARSAETAEQAGAAHKAQILLLRETVETLRATRDHLRVSHETTREALAQSRNASDQARSRQNQQLADREIALARLQEATVRQASLQDTLDRLDAALQGLPDALRASQIQADEAAQALSQITAQCEVLAEALAGSRLAAQSLAAEHETTARRIAALERDEAGLTRTLAALNDEMPRDADLAALEATLDDRRKARQGHETQIHRLTKQHQDSRLAVAEAEQNAAQAQRDATQASMALDTLNARLTALGEQIARHEAERDALDATRMSDDALRQEEARAEALREARDKAREEAARRQGVFAEVQHALAQAEADMSGSARQRALLANEHEQARQACVRHDAQLSEFAVQRDRLLAEMPQEAAIEAAHLSREAIETQLATLAAERDSLSAERNTCHRACEAAEKASQTASARLMALRAQHDALRATQADTSLRDPAIEKLVIPEGLERAVSVALDHTIDASLNAQESRAWLNLPALENRPLPQPSETLHSLIEAPTALARCLSGIALVTDAATGDALQGALLPGQCLVSRDGALWRWDGYCDKGTLPSQALGRVEMVARLRALETEMISVEADLPALRHDSSALETHEQALAARLETLRDELHRKENALPPLRREEEALLARRDRVTGQIAQLDQRLREAEIQREEMTRRAIAAETALAELASAASLQEKLETLQQDSANARQKRDEAQTSSRAAETAYAEAREHATRARLQEEANAARTATLTTVLAQARQDREANEAERTALAQQDRHAALDVARTALDSRRKMFASLDSELAASRSAGEALGREIGTASRNLQTTRDLKLSLSSRLSALVPQHAAVVAALSEARNHHASLAAVPDLVPLEQELASHRAEEAIRRQHDLSCQNALREAAASLDKTIQEKEQITLRRAETASTIEGLEGDLERLAARVSEGEAELIRTNEETARLELALRETADSLAMAETDFAAAAETLSAIDTVIDTLEKTRRDEEQRCASARENAIRLQERLEQAHAQLARLDETRMEWPQQEPDLPLTEQSETTLKRRLSRAQKEREALGPVNLLAEQEYAEARDQSEHLAREHGELESAINRLRGSINALKKEGRERLQAVFVEVDHHFQSLFSRMFNGGKAHLGLVGSDDPLEAGLEIFAQPPGKKLSTLSLLSGGEQALTALSLIFATFRCQPSPLCILDEVDAPLDDANVERLCGLLKDMAEEAQTRFLIVTHHQLTMAHMDRLFGVTMQERGVSQVLSVDLSLAASFAESGPMAVAP